MQETEDNDLMRVVEAVSDGLPVDWEVETASHPGLRAVLEQLRLVQAVLSLQQAAETGSAPGPATASPAARGARTAAAMSAAGDPTRGAAGAANAAAEGAPRAASPVPAEWGTLRILERIGRGGYGEVFRAYDPAVQREVALKLRRTDRKPRRADDDRYLDEARKLARVHQRNVLVVHGADRHDGRVGLWTDLIEGRTLEELLRQLGPLDAQEAALIGLNLCRALAAVHEA